MHENMIAILITSVFIILRLVHGSSHCVPYDSKGAISNCWPKADQWEALRTNLTGKLHFLKTQDYIQCHNQGDDAFKLEKAANGMCMQYHDCSKAFCDKDKSWNIPEYSVEVHTVDDIKKTLAFANKHNIAVTIKTSGHSFSGSGTGYGTLMIWMNRFVKSGKVTKFKDSCNTPKVYDNVLKIGGGQVWKEAYDAVKDKFHIVGGGGLSVSAAGGWLMGGGLSALCRNLGMGIDNVLQFDVILANGEHVTADKCTNQELFWALRGGGGGTFGVVTAAYCKLHPVSKIVFSSISINDISTWPHPTNLTDSFLDFWVEKSPYLDKRWGGYWTLNSYILYFQGSMADAEATFLNNVKKWIDSKTKDAKDSISFHASIHNSYYDQRGREYATTDKTGQKIFNIASRLIPRSFVVNDPAAAKSMLKWMVRNGFYTFNYILGGVMMDVNETDTAVHPAMRKAIWQIETFDERLIQMLRREVKNTGAGYNHASKNEPDWEDTFWGSNLARLQELKQNYDPYNVFNCWHCVGYQKMEPNPISASSRTNVSYFFLILCLMLCCLVS